MRKRIAIFFTLLVMSVSAQAANDDWIVWRAAVLRIVQMIGTNDISWFVHVYSDAVKWVDFETGSINEHTWGECTTSGADPKTWVELER